MLSMLSRTEYHFKNWMIDKNLENVLALDFVNVYIETLIGANPNKIIFLYYYGY